MNKRLVGIVLAGAGLVLVVLSVFGIGSGDGFGSWQLVGTVVGGAALILGLALVYAPRRGEIEPGPEK